MSLFDSASLVVTPSGYKEDKLYSIKPTDGSGDLVVTRATTATRVNSAGLIEPVAYNLFTYSQDFDNAAWTKLNVTISANSTTAPNGTLTADTLTNSSTGYGLWQTLDVVAGVTYTFSFYVKKGTNTSYILSVIDASTFTGITSLDYSAQTSSSEWVRIEKTFTIPSGTATIRIYPMRDGSSTGTAFLWGSQLVSGSSAKEYFPTTDRLDVPRLDYTNSSCPSILVEPQRTNSQKYSEDLSNGSNYSTGNASISTNQTTSPDGNNTADKLVESNTNARHELYTSPLTYSGTTAISFFAKVAGRRYLACFLGGDPSKGGAIFDLQSGVVSLTSGGTNATIQNFGDGWYRCSFTSTLTGSSSLYTCLRTNASIVDVQTYLGDGTSGVYIWGMQQELTSTYPTSYIPTIASSVTRNADVISKTGISSLIGQTEGTMFVDFYYNGLANNHMIINDSSFTSYIYINSQIAGQLWGQIQNIGIQFSVSATAGRYKCALAYKSGNSAFYVNGVQVGTSATAFSLSNNIATLDYTISTPKNNINASALWKTRLSNTELISLTTI